MSKANRWIALDQSALNTPIQQRIRGADVEVMVPPHDLPDALCCFYDDQQRIYVILFRYAAGTTPDPNRWKESPRLQNSPISRETLEWPACEPWPGALQLLGTNCPEPARRQTTFLVDDYSGRLLGIVIPYDGATRAATDYQLDQAIQMAIELLSQMATTPPPWSHGAAARGGNYRAVKKALATKSHEIIKMLHAR